MASVLTRRSKLCSPICNSIIFQLSRRQNQNLPPIPSWYKMPETFNHVVFPPGARRTLPELQKIPVYQELIEEIEAKNENLGITKKISKKKAVKTPQFTKQLIEIRGPELYHNQLIHKQYGLAAVTGGFLHYKHLETIRQSLNHHIERVEIYKDAFALWRIPAPWLPRPKKGRGVKMGGGKGKPHHYVTPVKSGRIIVELGGKIVYDQAQKLLAELSFKMPFSAKFVDYNDMLIENEKNEQLKLMNKNRYSWQYCMKWNMHGCSHWLKEYDYQWGGEYM